MPVVGLRRRGAFAALFTVCRRLAPPTSAVLRRALPALTGGLADTVINASPAALARGVATGIQFSPVDAATLRNALSRLCTLYKTPQTWSRIQANAMAQPVGWDQSAQAYADLYAGLTTTR